MLRLFQALPLPRAALFYAAGLGVIAALCIIIYVDSQRDAHRMLALRQGSPDAVAVELFDPEQHSGATGEVLIRAQIDTSLPMQVVFRQGLALRRALAYPLMPVEARRGAGDARVLGYFHLVTDRPEAEVLDFATIMPGFEKVGDIGPIVLLNGEVDAPKALTRAVSSLLADRGRPMADRLLGVKPYASGRIGALAAPHPSSWRWGALLAGLLLLATGLALSHLHPYVSERQRLAQIARAGRKRRGATPALETQKGRTRLAPLAPDQRTEKPRRMGPLTRMVIEGWRWVRAFRNPG